MPLCEEGIVTFIRTLPSTFIAGPLGIRINFVCRISEMGDFFTTYVILTAIVATFPVCCIAISTAGKWLFNRQTCRVFDLFHDRISMRFTNAAELQ